MTEHAILAAFAGWRVASLFVTETGPGDVFGKIRRWATREPEGAGIVGPPRPFIGGLLSCVWCVSVWSVAGAWLFGDAVSWTPVAIVAAMGAAVVVERSIRR